MMNLRQAVANFTRHAASPEYPGYDTQGKCATFSVLAPSPTFRSISIGEALAQQRRVLISVREMAHSRYYEDTYTEDDAARLCQISGLVPDDMAKFRIDLNKIAEVYRWEAAKFSDLPRSSDVARDLDSLLKRIARLDSGLENLPDEAAWALKKSIEKNNSSDFGLLVTGKLASNTPSLTLPLPEDANPVLGLCLGTPEFRNILSGLERAVQDAIADLPKRPRGQLRDYGLRLWMINIKSLWEQTTNRPFTRDVTSDGEAITPAASFCVAAFHCIAPSYPETRILWEMRDCIRET